MANKYLAENESIQGLMLKDKAFICTKTKGLDYKTSYDALLLQLEKDIAYKQFLRDVGEDFKFIVHNKNRDELKIEDDMFRYVLFNGQAGTKAEYPEYCEKFGITTDTFNFPDLKDGYLVSNPIASGTANGTYILDSLKSHNHTTPDHTHNLKDISFTIGIRTIDDNSSIIFFNGLKKLANSTLSRIGAGLGLVGEYENYQFSSHDKGLTKTDLGGGGNTGATGESQTAGRRTTAQIYVKAKFLG